MSAQPPQAGTWTLSSLSPLRDNCRQPSLLHLKDIATIELGSNSYSDISHVSGKSAGLIGIQQLPGANALEVASKVKAKLGELSQYFPEGVSYRVIMDTTTYVTASIDEVLVTFVETTLIVMIVILIFLQSWRAVIIPMIAIPVSLIATFAVMKLLGFSLNTLTLFGLVLAIAIVVDDAIVVVEDCVYPHGFYQRHHRRALQAVCIDYRHLGSLLGIQCSDVYAGHVRAVS